LVSLSFLFLALLLPGILYLHQIPNVKLPLWPLV